MKTLGQLRQKHDLRMENYKLKTDLFNIQKKLQESINEIEVIEKRKVTGYYAFIGFEDGKPMAMGIYHEDTDPEKIGDEILQRVQVIVPIPAPEHLKEFDGF